MSGFIKVTGHLYMVKNQNGLNNALYDYYSATDNGENFTKTKKEVREMVQNIPDYYPISVVIVDLSFECNRLYLEFFDMDEVSHGSMGATLMLPNDFALRRWALNSTNFKLITNENRY